MTVDNSELILPFIPEKDDGDTFVYTELLNRGQKKGNNGRRLLKTFYHRDRDDFLRVLPDIKMLCEYSGIRACTRLSPRSAKRVGKEFTRVVVEACCAENWWAMKSLYNSACGRTSPNQKIWIWDVDRSWIDENTDGGFHREGVVYPTQWLQESGFYLASIPSKTGFHLLSKPFDVRKWPFPGIDVHKDNPTNLYIPDGAD